MVFTLPMVAFLTIVGFEANPVPESAAVVQSADMFALAIPLPTTETPEPLPSETPVPTATPTQTPLPPTRTPLPSPTIDTRPRAARVPILMYHYISVPPLDADKYRLDLSVTPANFQAQMEYLANEGYHPIRLSDLSEHLLNGKPLPSKPIVLTFDDGYLDNYENALPVLVKHKFTGTFFIITDFVEEKRPGYMNWDQIEELAINGMEIGSHTESHPDLKIQTRAVQQSQILGSKKMIEARIGTPVKSFCYPSSSYDSRTLAVLESSGYLGAVTEINGVYQSGVDIFEMRRIRVRGSYSVVDFGYWIKYWMTSGK